MKGKKEGQVDEVDGGKVNETERERGGGGGPTSIHLQLRHGKSFKPLKKESYQTPEKVITPLKNFHAPDKVFMPLKKVFMPLKSKVVSF